MPAKRTSRSEESDGRAPINLWSQAALVLVGSVTVARFLTTENPRGWTGPLSVGVYAEPGPGPVSTLIFAGLLLLAFCCWLVGCAQSGRMIRWPRWLVLSVLLMGGATIAAAGLAGQKQIAANRAADWISQWLVFLMLLDLLASRSFGRIMLAAVIATGALVALKCIYQVQVEFPDMLAQYGDDPARMLSGLGVGPGTNKAAQLLERMRQGQATGYFAVGNVTASVLILTTMAALGLAVDRLFTIGQKFSAFFGVLLLGLAGLMVWAIVLTASRGAMGGLLAGGVLFAGYALVKRLLARRYAAVRLSRYYRTIVVAVLAMVLAGVVVVAGCGLGLGSLGPRTLTYRWHYWVGSAGMFGDWPWLGVGPGNFKFHYPAHKLAEAVEEVANPHNPVVQMFTETGLLGGAALVSCLGAIFILATKPGGAAVESSKGKRSKQAFLRPMVWLVLLAGGAFGLRTALNLEGAALGRLISFSERSADVHLLVLGVIGPLAVWAIAYLIGVCDSDDLSGKDLPATPMLRVAIVCGLAGFVLHNQITFALLHGGGGTVFWVFAALAIAMRRRGDGQEYRLGAVDRYVVVAGAAVGLVMFGWSVLWPVAKEQRHLQRAMRDYRLAQTIKSIDGSLSKGIAKVIEGELVEAARALPGDPWPDTFAARVLAESGQIDQALAYQREAVRKNPYDWTRRWDLAQLLAAKARPSKSPDNWESSIKAWRRALECYPTSPMLHEGLADAFAAGQDWPGAVEHYNQALECDDAKKVDRNYQWPDSRREQVEQKLDKAVSEVKKDAEEYR